MNIVLIFLAYALIAGISFGIMRRFTSDDDFLFPIQVTGATFWPISLLILPLLGIGYLGYRIATPKKKEE